MGNIGDFELMRRRQVVQLAAQILQSGAHYLWGAQGDGHVRMCPNQVAGNGEKYLFAASLRGTTQFVCAGRADNPAIARLQRRDTIEQAREAQTAGDTGDYRWARFYRDGDTVNPSPSGLVYGESCEGKLHFDCAGFVRHCFRAILNMPIGGMKGRTTVVWSRLQRGGGGGTTSGIGDADIYPGDILYGGAHVGLATGRPEYGAALPNMAIHAYYSKAGVVSTSITAQPNWAEVRRWNDWGQPLSWAPSAMA